jgi:hypothetical protein
MSTLALPRPGITGLRRAAASVAVAALVGSAAFVTWAWQGPELAPDVRLAVFPPVLTRVEAFRAIILGNAIPVAQTAIPNLWLIHVDPNQPEEIRGALVTGVGPFVRLASAACLTARGKTP